MSNLVPEGWSESKIGDAVLSSKGGVSVNSENRPKIGGEFGILKTSSVYDGRFIPSEHKTILHDEVARAAVNPRKGHILFSRMNTPALVGQSGYVDKEYQDLFIPDRLWQLEINQQFSSKWLSYILRSQKVVKSITDAATGTSNSMKNIAKPNLMSIPINTPPLPEQQKIAAILTSVDEVIEKTQAQIDKLKDLKTAMMQELLTNGVGTKQGTVDGEGYIPHTEFKDSPVGRIPKSWDVKSFEDVFTLKNGVNKGKEFFGVGGPIISYRNVFDGNGIYDSMLTAKVDLTENELNRFRVNYGDVFITRTSETADEIGYTNVYLGTRDDVVFNGFVIRARQKVELLDFEYCKYAFQSYSIRNQMRLNSKFTTRAGISGESLNRILIAIPSRSEQQSIAKSISSIDLRILSLSKSKQAKVLIKKALMQDLLTGKVRVKLNSGNELSLQASSYTNPS